MYQPSSGLPETIPDFTPAGENGGGFLWILSLSVKESISPGRGRQPKAENLLPT